MDKVQQIKTYPQNKKKEWRLCQSSEAKYRMEAIDEFLEVLKVLNSLPKEPVNKDLEEAATNYAMHIDFNDNHTLIGNEYDAFKAGAQWQQERFEQNRLKACDSQTKEELEREWSFVEKVIHEEHRQPTYSDAIEFGRKLMKEQIMTDAVDAYISDEGTGKSLRFDTNAFMAAWNKYKDGDKLKLIIIKED